MKPMNQDDLRAVLQALPKDIRDMLRAHPTRLYVCGGFVRDTIRGEQATDIDICGDDAILLQRVANDLVNTRHGSVRLHKTDNALTVLAGGYRPVQMITRWVFTTPEECVKSFDFTICQAAVWWARDRAALEIVDHVDWRGMVSDTFYEDLAAQRLRYTAPERDEDSGGSALRLLKFVRRGYRISMEDYAKVIARLLCGGQERKSQDETLWQSEALVAKEVSSRLRVVDPMRPIDGLEMADEHAKIEDL